MIKYVVYGKGRGEIKTFKTIKQVKEFIKSMYESDKRLGFKDEYYYVSIFY